MLAGSRLVVAVAILWIVSISMLIPLEMTEYVWCQTVR